MLVQKKNVKNLFPTFVCHEAFLTRKEIELCLEEVGRIEQFDRVGKSWSLKNYPGGYTSYSSIDRLDVFSSTFARISEKLKRRMLNFAKFLEIDLKQNPLSLTQMWVNVQREGGHHSAHIHPLATLSGTFYLSLPTVGSSAIRFEDPRLGFFMGSAPRKKNVRLENQRWVDIQPKTGDLIMFESWLRHEVPSGKSSTRSPRISISFNFG